MNMRTSQTIALVLAAGLALAIAVLSQNTQTLAGAILIVIYLVGALTAYLAPTILAWQRGIDKGIELLFGINLFLGWTVLFWLFCLLWAALGQTREQAAFYRAGLVQMHRKGN